MSESIQQLEADIDTFFNELCTAIDTQKISQATIDFIQERIRLILETADTFPNRHKAKLTRLKEHLSTCRKNWRRSKHFELADAVDQIRVRIHEIREGSMSEIVQLSRASSGIATSFAKRFNDKLDSSEIREQGLDITKVPKPLIPMLNKCVNGARSLNGVNSKQKSRVKNTFRKTVDCSRDTGIYLFILHQKLGAIDQFCSDKPKFRPLLVHLRELIRKIEPYLSSEVTPEMLEAVDLKAINEKISELVEALA